MMHFRKRLAALLAAVSLLTGANAAAGDNDVKSVYGLLAFSNNQYTLTNSLVSFPLYGEGNAEYEAAVYFGNTSTAGAYTTDGNYYVASTKLNGTTEVPDALVRMNLESGTTTTVGSLSGFDFFVNDMTYDHSTSTMYAVAKVNESCSALYTIDLKTGKGNKVATLDRKFFTLAADWGGQLYAISFGGEFCKIGKHDGKVTIVGHTGCYPEKFQSMEFDHGTRTLWWAATTHRVNDSGTIELQETYMATVDTATGVATRGRALGDDQVVGIYIPYIVVPDGAPQAVENLTATAADGGDYAATLCWTNPDKTFGGEPVKSFTKVQILRDGVPVGTAVSPQPGRESTYTDVIGGRGGAIHSWTVVASTAAGEGVPASVEAFAGADVPAAVAEVGVERLSNNSARVTWQPVTSGAHGGWLDTSTLSYSVTRLPDNTVVAENLTSTEWTEPGVTVQGSYSYQVAAHNADGVSAPAESPVITLGPNLGFPHTDGFSAEEFSKWMVVDGNGDGNTWTFSEISWAKAAGAYFMAANNAGDDWLISPAFEFEANSTYKVTLSSLANGNHSIDFVLLKEYDHSAPVKNLGNLALTRAWALGQQQFIFDTDAAGAFNLALHQLTEAGNSYLIIDEIQIEKLVDNNLAAIEIAGNQKPVTGNAYPYAVTVANRGKLARSGFAVELADASGAVCGSTQVAEPLAPGETRSVYVNCTVADGLTSLRGRIADPLDEIASDNETAAIEITVMPLGTPEEVVVGTKKGMASYSPFYFSSKYSVNQQVYSANEIGITRGRITAIRYDYKTSSYSNPPAGADIKVYLANTELTTAVDGWIPMEELTLVYEGSIDMVKGEGVLDLELTKAFDYDGGNLAIVTMHSLENAGQTYYSGVQFPYYSSPLAGNVPLYYSSPSPIAYGEVSGSKATYYGNTVVTLLMQTGGATLSGTVTDVDGAPVPGATVEVEPLHASATSDAAGAYRFDFVPNGSYAVSAAKLGYEGGDKVDVNVSDADAEVNFTMVKLPAYDVSGRVLDAHGAPVAGAALSLEGYQPLTAVSGADGRFVFENVVSKPSVITVSKDWFAPAATEEFTPATDPDLGDITMGYAHYTAGNVIADATESSLAVTWDGPDKKSVARFDAGVVSSQIGISNDVGTSILGTAVRRPMVVDRLDWYITSEGGPHHTVNIYIYDLDAAGNPTGTLLYSERSVFTTDDQWTSHELTEPVSAPNGCLVALNYPGFIGLGIDTGSKEWPMAMNTYYYSLDFAGGEFTECEKIGLDGNLMLRAAGYAYPEENNPVANVGETREALPEWYAYNVWRGKGTEPSDWTLVTEQPVSDNTAADSSWESLAPGIYRYAVAPVYPDGTMSERVLSACVLKDAYSTLSIEAVTNSHSASAAGADVVLYNADRSNEYKAVLDASGKATISDVWKDVYTLELRLAGYKPLVKELDITKASELSTGRLMLEEIIATPVNLKLYENADGTLRMTWNESGEIADDFESYSAFAAPGDDVLPWQCLDADGGRTFAESTYDFPGRTTPMSFIVFNPRETSPSMYEERSASHAHSGDQHLACFASVSGNDDYLISPRLTYHTPFSFAFWAKGYSLTYGETIQVGYSTTTAEPSAFTWVSGVVNVPMQRWERYEYDMPAEARYVAVRCTSADGFTLFVDDVEISSGNGFEMNTSISGPEVVYEVTLDGHPVATVEDAFCGLGEVTDDVHTVAVKAVYASGSSDEATLTFGTSGIVSPEGDGSLDVVVSAAGYAEISGEFDGADLYDLSGRMVARFGNENRRIDLGGMAVGVYILDVHTPAGNRPFKIAVK